MTFVYFSFALTVTEFEKITLLKFPCASNNDVFPAFSIEYTHVDTKNKLGLEK